MKSDRTNTIAKLLPVILKLVIITCIALVFANSVSASEYPPVHPGYPDEFDRRGIVDIVHEDSFVINDSMYFISGQTQYNGPKGKVSKSVFTPGDEVGIIVEPERQIITMWLIKNGQLDTGGKAGNKKQVDTTLEIYQENGVWKN